MLVLCVCVWRRGAGDIKSNVSCLFPIPLWPSKFHRRIACSFVCLVLTTETSLLSFPISFFLSFLTFLQPSTNSQFQGMNPVVAETKQLMQEKSILSSYLFILVVDELIVD